MTQRQWGWVMGLGTAGVILVFAAGILQAGALGIIGVVLLLFSLVVVVQGTISSESPPVSMGWHDDPDDPHKLRYHDGRNWTNKTANKP